MNNEKKTPPPFFRPAGGGAMMSGFARGSGMMNLGAQKARNFRGTLTRFLGYLRPYRLQLLIVFGCVVLGSLFTIIGPKILGTVTTSIFAGLIAKTKGLPGAQIDFAGIAQTLLWLAGLYVLSALFVYLQQAMMTSIAQRVVYTLRKEADQKLSRLPLNFFDGHPHGDILSRVVNDLDMISGTLQQSLGQFITSAVSLTGVIILMLSISWILTLIICVTLPLSLFITAFMAKRSQRYFINQQRALGAVNSHIEEAYAGHLIVKAFTFEQTALDEFNERNDTLYEQGWRAQFISSTIMPLMSSLGNLGYIGIAVVGSILVLTQGLAIGDVQAFIQYSTQLTMPITQLANFSNIIQSTIAAAERVFELLDETEEVADTQAAQALPALQGAITFEHVAFGYKEQQLLMKDLHIHVDPGQTVAIVGPTGAGKTTFVNLLMRFYDLRSGHILIDQHDIASLPRGELRQLFGMVLQDTWLFSGTIRDNIAYGRDYVTEEEIVQAAASAHADHFIKTLPDGYNTLLNQDTTNLSQGQKQLLTIARAILAQPTFLILDEATSSVDTRTELHIQKAVTHIMQGRTSFVIAHRLSTIRDADLILVMKDGDIIEQGTHTQLMAQNGFYAELYQSQFTGNTLTVEVKEQPFFPGTIGGFSREKMMEFIKQKQANNKEEII